MKLKSEDYQELSETYVRLIRRKSPVIAYYLEKIRQQHGAHATCRTALAFLFNRKLLEQHQCPERDKYEFYLREYPQAVDLVAEMFQAAMFEKASSVDSMN